MQFAVLLIFLIDILLWNPTTAVGLGTNDTDFFTTVKTSQTIYTSTDIPKKNVNSSTVHEKTTNKPYNASHVDTSKIEQFKEELMGYLNETINHRVQEQKHLGPIDCDLPLLPRESRLWRGNETHELDLPLKVGVSTACVGCSATTEGWELSTDIQIGDVLILRIDDKSLRQHLNASDQLSTTVTSKGAISQPRVFEVMTQQEYSRCEFNKGKIRDITPLEENGVMLFTFYKNLTDGKHWFLVVSELWGTSKCVKLHVTVKSDYCGESQECSGKGVCYTNVSMDGYKCQCCAGNMGAFCEERSSCEPSPCLNNGICVDLTQPIHGLSYHCLCPYGYTGRNCERDPCFSSPCLNGGTCLSMSLNSTTTYRCSCLEDWTGSRCQLSINSTCISDPCVHGICIEDRNKSPDGGLSKRRCYCEPGYTGDRCDQEYNECESIPCANGGTCTDLIGTYSCSCSRGYTGHNCQSKVDLCSPNPCPTHQFCIDRGDVHACECPHGYMGDECTEIATSACDHNPCSHGGTCWNGVDTFYCSCRPGYTGKLCDEPFVLETVVGNPNDLFTGGGAVRESGLPMGLYHDRLHNIYIAAGTLGAAIAIVGVVVTACHCRVNRTYSRLLSRLSRTEEPPSTTTHHWLDNTRSPNQPHTLTPALHEADMYYTLDFSDNQSSPLIQ